MAIVFDHPLGWVLDEQRWYNACYERLGYHILPALYEIDEPFRMDSQVEAMNRRMQQSVTTSDQLTVVISGRKRRRKTETEEDEAIAALKRDFDELITEARRSGCFKEVPQAGTLLTNNRKARDAARTAEDRVRLPDIVEEGPGLSIDPKCPKADLRLVDGSSDDPEALKGRTCVNGESRPIVVRLATGKGEECPYLVPPNCRFAWGDVSEEVNRLAAGSRYLFDFIIFDPPWHNKSVKRQKTYATQDEIYLEGLPIGKLLKPGALVAIWVTNSPSYYAYVVETLLPKWGLELEAQWFWLKVTTSGEPVCPYRQGFKMPFEIILFARSASAIGGQRDRLPDRKLIVSVPSALPSRKPPLLDVVKSYIPGTPVSCLELYARYLLPDTYSIGNQVIKFQCAEYFEKCNVH